MRPRTDPEIAAVLYAGTGSAAAPPMEPGDWRGRRQAFESMIATIERDRHTPAGGVSCRSFPVESSDGAELAVRWYHRRADPVAGPAVVYLHGGGMFHGSLDLYDGIVRRYVARTGVPMLAVGYRRAPEHAHPVPVEDCYAGLCWLAARADRFGVDPSRVAVMGDSAGGGLAAGTALMARDRGGPALAQQILVCPMLDDRTPDAPPALRSHLTWSYADNVTAWATLLGDRVGAAGVSCYAAPARAVDLTGLPPTYLEVGELDLFAREVVRFAQRLVEAGVPVEFHLHRGAPHGFDFLAPATELAHRAQTERARAIALL
ncbi:MAG TPA: alpha/beta hydrolase [Pseudonocardia sp.]|nr:alpha/beta hydrolase [Pseudonocardia sp.]